MSYQEFYAELFRPVEDKIGAIDRDTLMPLIGFDAGGPLTLCTVGYKRRKYPTYLSCELAVRTAQIPSKAVGRYELMMTCDDERWACSVLSELGRMTMAARFEPGHTIDIGPYVGRSSRVQGLIFEQFSTGKIGRRRVGILGLVGVTRSELNVAMAHGSARVLSELKSAGTYPRTLVKRGSIR